MTLAAGSRLAGVLQIGPIVMSEDEKSYACSTRKMISHLFLVEAGKSMS